MQTSVKEPPPLLSLIPRSVTVTSAGIDFGHPGSLIPVEWAGLDSLALGPKYSWAVLFPGHFVRLKDEHMIQSETTKFCIDFWKRKSLFICRTSFESLPDLKLP